MTYALQLDRAGTRPLLVLEGELRIDEVRPEASGANLRVVAVLASLADKVRVGDRLFLIPLPDAPKVYL